MVTVVCAGCGAAFKRKRSDTLAKGRPKTAQFCSRACRRNRIGRACELCGRAFTLSAYEAAKDGKGRWCSRRCADIGRKRGERRTCETCGAAFYVYPSDLSDPRRALRFCSMSCYKPVRGKATKGRPKSEIARARQSAAMKGKHTGPRLPPISVTCLGCGVTTAYTGRKRHFAKRRRFCTMACWFAYVRAHPGTHPAFRGGREPYYGPDWREQARRARARDNDTCQDCGRHQTTPLLDVHHLVARRVFKGDHKAANELGNLVTLCKSCHKRREGAAAIL